MVGLSDFYRKMEADLVYEIKDRGEGFRVTNAFGMNYNDFYVEGPFNKKYVVLENINKGAGVRVLTVLGEKGEALDFAYDRALNDAKARKQIGEIVMKARGGQGIQTISIQDITERSKQNKLEKVIL